MESISLGLNETHYNSDILKLSKLAEQIPQLKNELSNIVGINLNQSVFKDIISNGGKTAFKELEKAYNSDTKAIRLPSSKEAIRQQFEHSKQFLSDLIGRYAKLKRLLDFGIISDTGEYSFNENYLEKLKEAHTRLLTDPKEVELYNAKVKASEAFNSFKNLIHNDNSFKYRNDLVFAHMVSPDTALNYKLLANGVGK